MSFPRCHACTADGRRCWLHPGHAGKHLVFPRTRTEEAAKRATHRIFMARRDVPLEKLSAAYFDEIIAGGLST